MAYRGPARDRRGRISRRISFKRVSIRARTKASYQKRAGEDPSVRNVKYLLYLEGLLSKSRVSGIWGWRARRAYGKWQRKLGYTGSDADGLPGVTSLRRLASKHGYAVVSTHYKPPAPKPQPAPVPSRVTSPVPGYRVTFPYGVPSGRYSAGFHTGDDYAAPTGAAVVAVKGGTIAGVAWDGAYGRRIILRSGLRDYWFCHLSSYSVSYGQKVKAGQRIGRVGATGNVTGPHLHFEDRPRWGRYGNVRRPRW